MLTHAGKLCKTHEHGAGPDRIIGIRFEVLWASVAREEPGKSL
jgi:hypothetical protein